MSKCRLGTKYFPRFVLSLCIKRAYWPQHWLLKVKTINDGIADYWEFRRLAGLISPKYQPIQELLHFAPLAVIVKSGHVMEQRRKKRFDLNLEVIISRIGRRRVNRLGRTKNISSSGVLLSVEGSFEAGQRVAYIIIIPMLESVEMRIQCEGKIMRCGVREIAVTLARRGFQRIITVAETKKAEQVER